MEPLSAFTLYVRPDNIAVITIDVPGEKMNTLKSTFVGDIRRVLKQITDNKQLQGAIFISGKPDNFIAGADIQMIDNCKTASEAEALAREGQRIIDEIRALPVPVVAAIHGTCLGGGLELALACHRRVCSDDDSLTRLGLPEVQLGLLPGAGGTQYLLRLIGVSRALQMMLTANSLRPHQALKTGLVDEVVPRSILLEAAVEQVKKGRDAVRKLSVRERILTGPLGRALLFSIVTKQTQHKTQGNYPAALRILDVVRLGLAQNIQVGLMSEAQAFGELAMTPQSKALRELFFAVTDLKKDAESMAPPAVIKEVAVLGGGLMGAGIAYVTAVKAGLPVRIKDINQKGVNYALGYSWSLLDKKVRCHHITPQERDRKMAHLSGSADYRSFQQRDVVIEAVFEDLALKQQMVAEVEQHAAPHTIFASNTSSLPIASIAENAARPGQVIGLHFFSPVEKMPLVEVIPHAGTTPETLATMVALAKKQGKTAIVVGDVPGFYVNRILAPYINEAMHCLMEGEPIDNIDRALVKFGFPVGPFQLLDEVGIDVGTKIIRVLEQAYGGRFTAPESAVAAILKDDRKGKKNGRGFYLYPAKARKNKKQADSAIYALVGVTPHVQMSPETIAQRCVMMMLNEAVRCLDEEGIRTTRDGDIGAVFGIGFPPFLGGPFRYMDSLGVDNVVTTMQRLASVNGDRFTPCEALVRMVCERQSFWPEDASKVQVAV